MSRDYLVLSHVPHMQLTKGVLGKRLNVDVHDVSLYPVVLLTEEQIVNPLYLTNAPACFLQPPQGFPLNVCWRDNNQPEVGPGVVVVPGVQDGHAQHHGVPRLRLAGRHAPD